MGGGSSRKSLTTVIKDPLKLFLLLASLVFILGACSDSDSSSEKSSTCFELNEDKTQVIGYLETAENGEACPKDVVIPNGVTNIAENAFKDQGLTSVKIPESVTEIEAYAFLGNTFSSYVYIPDEDTQVDTTAFDSGVAVAVQGTDSCFVRDSNNATILAHYPCSASTVEIPSDITSIADEVFENKGLTSVTLPQNLTSIGNNAFKDNNLESLDIPNSVTDIGGSAFTGNSFSSYVYIPNENANVDTSAFDSSIVVVVEGTEGCFVRDSNNATILAHYLCSASTVEIPSDITSIADEVFENKGLTSVTLPQNLTSIGNNAFKDNNLESLDIPNSVTDIGESTFVGNSFSSYVYIPNENANVDTSAFDSSIVVVVEGTESCFIRDANDSTTLTDYFCLATTVEIPDDVTNIADNVFENKGLTSVTLPQNLTSIGNNAFKDNSLESLDIPNSVTDIGDSAFVGNSFSSYVYIPNENANVDTSAFDSSIVVVVVEGTESCFVRDSNNATILTHYPCSASTVVIPSDITSIADSVFENKSLTSVTLPQNLTSIGNNAFKDNSLESLDIPDSVINIGANAFSGNSFSSYIYIPNENATVDVTAFDSIVIVTIEGTDSCFEISNNTLSDYYCMEQDITIPNGVTNIAASAFKNKNLTSVNLPDGLTSIGIKAFKGNNLESLDIPGSVTNIGDSAFAGNSDLELYIFPSSSNPTVGNNAFPNGYAIATKDVCFEFDATDTGKINDYYDNEDDNTSNPACPKDVVIPQGVTSIGSYAFYNYSLTSVIIPESVTSIGNKAFWVNSLISVTIPEGVTSIGDNAFKENSLTSVIIGSGVTSIEAQAFEDNESSLTVCIEAQQSNVTVSATAFDSGITPTYETDGDCFN